MNTDDLKELAEKLLAEARRTDRTATIKGPLVFHRPLTDREVDALLVAGCDKIQFPSEPNPLEHVEF